MADRRTPPGSTRRGSRFTLRARLTLAFAAVFTVAGAALIGGLFAFMVAVPSYLVSIPSDEDPQFTDTTGSGDGFWTEVLPDDGIICPDDGSECVDFSEGGYYAGPVDAPDEWLYFDDPQRVLLQFLGVGSLCLLVIAALSTLASWLLVGRLLRPLRELKDAAQSASRGDFGHRVAVGGRRDEVVELAETFDHMLSRLQRFVRDQRRVAAQASHELQGPLTTTRVLLEEGAGEPLDAEAAARLLDRLRVSNERSIALVESVLDLAELSLVDLVGEHVEVSALVDSAVAATAGRAAAASVEITTSDLPGSVYGDPLLLEQALVNLVGNAVKHNRRGGRVWLRSRVAPGTVEIVIENTGRMVDHGEFARLTHPFYRHDPTAPDSHGLGLPFVRTVVEAHDARLDLVPREEGGLTVTLQLASEPKGSTVA
ncbi:HAMP domain-containing histidine kinase [Herbiconiux moechotypicola]|uniref:histidine kinase n=1 Tax=Herbiconiux moechotypicola TaxID=637393 RepID=A0ABP5QS15_9MICO|nr:HAMP domain-containing sensor histidine kinase [Herbiconiux moechotypicola]MCS5730606.1 HAMP domain-containing histidine kinase [Herbiconiux moechotypicola]